MRRALVLGTALIFVVVGITLVMRHRQEKTVQATTQPQLVAVDVAMPVRATVKRTIEVYGSLSPKTATTVKSELVGKVSLMHVKEWDPVKPGQVLLEMDPTDFHLEVNRNLSGLKMAKAQLLQAQVDLNRARREWDRSQKLKAGGLITGQELDERRTALESSEARVSLANAQVSQAEAQLAESRRHLTKTSIVAPIEGIISERKVDVGDFLDKGTLLFTLVDNRLLDLTANVPATDLPLVAEGQTLTFLVDGIPDRTFTGCVKRINPTVNANDRTGRILAEVPNREGELRGGLYARGRVLVQEKPDALVIDKAALSNWNLDHGTATVLVVSPDGMVHARRVRTGIGLDNAVEVVDGLAETERVIIRGGFNVREGDRVLVNQGDNGGYGMVGGASLAKAPTDGGES